LEDITVNEDEFLDKITGLTYLAQGHDSFGQIEAGEAARKERDQVLKDFLMARQVNGDEESMQ